MKFLLLSILIMSQAVFAAEYADKIKADITHYETTKKFIEKEVEIFNKNIKGRKKNYPAKIDCINLVPEFGILNPTGLKRLKASCDGYVLEYTQLRKNIATELLAGKIKNDKDLTLLRSKAGDLKYENIVRKRAVISEYWRNFQDNPDEKIAASFIYSNLSNSAVAATFKKDSQKKGKYILKDGSALPLYIQE